MTLDGKIARAPKEMVDWTSREDKRYFKQLTVKAGVVIMGRATFETLNKPLSQRLTLVITHHPEKYQSIQQRDVLEFTSEPPKKVIDILAEKGYDTAVVCGGSAVYSLFLKARLINEIHLTITPRIFGKGIPLFYGVDAEEVKCSLIGVKRLGERELLIKYKTIF